MTLESDLSDKSDVFDKIGASCDTPWVCLQQSGLARGNESPLGYTARRLTAG